MAELKEAKFVRHRDKPSEVKRRELFCKLGNGSLAAVCGITGSRPIDTLKTQLQLHPEMNNARIGTKMISGYTKILRQSGFFRGLYSGYFVNLAFIVPEKTVKLVSNDRLRERFKDGNGHISRPKEFLAAGLSGLLQSFVLTPNEGFKVHCQDGKRFREVWKTKTVGKTPVEATRLMYSGWTATVCRDVPFTIILFPLYEEMRRRLTKTGEKPSSAVNATSGFIAGGIAGLVMNPIDVIKSRAQRNFLSFSGALKTVSAEASISGQPIVGYTRIFASGGGMHSLYCAILFGITQLVFDFMPMERLTASI